MTTQLRLQERAITSSDAGIFILDATSQNSPIIYANPAFTRITGYSVKDHIGEETIVLLQGTAMQNNLSALRSIHKSKTGKSSILREYRKDGTQFWAELSLSPVCNEAGRLTHYVGIVNDVTRRRQAELALSEREESLKLALEELKASHKELKVTQLQLIQSAKLESIGTLAAGVAHEVKNPLQTMLMGLEFVSNNLNGNREELAEAMDDMKEAVTRANGIIQELLQMTAASKLTLQGEDFNAVVHRSCRLLNSEIMASRVEVVFQLQENLPPALIDKSKMEQVLINLILNAIQAITPAQGGSITISTRLDRINEDFLRNSLVAAQFELGESVLVASIQDTGEGISEEHLSKIFDPFFSTKAVGVGTGLGLSVVRKIIDLCHGSIDIKNVPQGGTLVTLVLKTANGSCPLIRNDSRESFHPKRPVNFAGMAAPPNPN
jgi:PAS domain S-box-containing protein